MVKWQPCEIGDVHEKLCLAKFCSCKILKSKSQDSPTTSLGNYHYQIHIWRIVPEAINRRAENVDLGSLEFLRFESTYILIYIYIYIQDNLEAGSGVCSGSPETMVSKKTWRTVTYKEGAQKPGNTQSVWVLNTSPPLQIFWSNTLKVLNKWNNTVRTRSCQLFENGL